MSNEPLFKKGEIVKLKTELEDTSLKQGDYGIVWAIYPYHMSKNNAVLIFDYEGTFWNREGNEIDSEFAGEDVIKVLKIEDVPFSKNMKEFWLYLNQKEN